VLPARLQVPLQRLAPLLPLGGQPRVGEDGVGQLLLRRHPCGLPRLLQLQPRLRRLLPVVDPLAAVPPGGRTKEVAEEHQAIQHRQRDDEPVAAAALRDVVRGVRQRRDWGRVGCLLHDASG